MIGESLDARGLRLEGLVLCDEDGGVYEVPRVVIERYRAAAERVTELAQDIGHRGAVAALGMLGAAPWTIHGGIYTADPAPSGSPIA